LQVTSVETKWVMKLHGSTGQGNPASASDDVLIGMDESLDDAGLPWPGGTVQLHHPFRLNGSHLQKASGQLSVNGGAERQEVYEMGRSRSQ